MIIALTVCMSTNVWADEIKTINLPEGVLAVKGKDGYQGAFPDMLNEAARRVGGPINLQSGPWLRSQQNGQRIAGAAVAPLTRVPEREDKYVWIEEILPLNLTFIVWEGTTDNFTDLESLRGQRIGVLRGSVADVLTSEMKFAKGEIFLASNGQSLARLLKHGRIDGWLIWDIYGLETLRSLHMEANVRTTFSHTAGQLYLATNPSVSISQVEKWRQVLRGMKGDGTISAIIKKYYGNKIVAVVSSNSVH